MGSLFQIGKRALGMMSWTAWSGSFSRSTHSGGTWMLAPGREARQHEAEQQGRTKREVARAAAAAAAAGFGTTTVAGTAAWVSAGTAVWVSAGTTTFAGPPAWVSADAIPRTAVRPIADHAGMRAVWPVIGIVGTIERVSTGSGAYVFGGKVGSIRGSTGVGAGVEADVNPANRIGSFGGEDTGAATFCGQRGGAACSSARASEKSHSIGDTLGRPA